MTCMSCIYVHTCIIYTARNYLLNSTCTTLTNIKYECIRELYHNRLFIDNSHIHILGTMLGEPRANHTVDYLLNNIFK